MALAARAPAPTRCGANPRSELWGQDARRRRRGPAGPKSGRRRLARHGSLVTLSQDAGMRAGTKVSAAPQHSKINDLAGPARSARP
jgi:hypothetical protein